MSEPLTRGGKHSGAAWTVERTERTERTERGTSEVRDEGGPRQRRAEVGSGGVVGRARETP